jgi:hypothetical protein
MSREPLGEPLRHDAEVGHAAFSPDGTKIVTVTDDGAVSLWEVPRKCDLGEPVRDEKTLKIALPPALTSINEDSSRRDEAMARIEKLAKGPLKAWHENGGKMGLVTEGLSPDESKVFNIAWEQSETGADRRVLRFWNLRTGKLIGEPANIPDEHAIDAVFSPDGSKALITAYKHILDMRQGETPGTAQLWDINSGKAIGEPMYHEDRFGREGRLSSDALKAAFSSGGAQVISCSGGVIRLWELKTQNDLPPAPKWAREWALAVAGWRFNSAGELVSIPFEKRLAAIRAERKGEDGWSRLARWVAMPAERRTLHPDSRHTLREIAERERDFGIAKSLEPAPALDPAAPENEHAIAQREHEYRFALARECLESALRYDPTIPLARLALAGVLEHTEAKKEAEERDHGVPARAAFLRDYELKHLPDDAKLWAKAVKLLHSQNDTARSEQALQKLEALNPAKASEVRTELGL